jgi:hypothetical protein
LSLAAAGAAVAVVVVLAAIEPTYLARLPAAVLQPSQHSASALWHIQSPLAAAALMPRAMIHRFQPLPLRAAVAVRDTMEQAETVEAEVVLPPQFPRQPLVPRRRVKGLTAALGLLDTMAARVAAARLLLVLREDSASAVMAGPDYLRRLLELP